MKKSLIIGMLIAVTCQMSFAATKGVDSVRKTVTEEVARPNEKIPQGADAKSAVARFIHGLGNTLSRIAKNADETELKAAMSRKITVANKTIALADVGQSIMKADQALNKINRNDLDAAGKAHFDAVREAVQVGTEFLGLANRTSDMGATVTEQSRLQVAALNKQLALIPDILTKMDTADVKSHIDAMKKGVAARVSPEMNGDVAFANSLKQGKSNEDFMEYLRRLADCE